MEKVISFLEQLQKNNNREWFNAHKDEYRSAKERFEAFAASLIAGIAEFDDTVAGLEVKDCTYRIYRDIRFSHDKRPYKCHFGVFVCPGGKKSGYGGYYLQVGPNETGYPGGNMLAAGHYCLDPASLKILREDIAYGGGDFKQALDVADGFKLDDEGMLKKVPNEFPKDCEYAGYLKYRAYCLVAYPGRSYMLQDGLLQRALDDFKKTRPFLGFLNRAIAYSRGIE